MHGDNLSYSGGPEGETTLIAELKPSRLNTSFSALMRSAFGPDYFTMPGENHYFPTREVMLADTALHVFPYLIDEVTASAENYTANVWTMRRKVSNAMKKAIPFVREQKERAEISGWIHRILDCTTTGPCDGDEVERYLLGRVRMWKYAYLELSQAGYPFNFQSNGKSAVFTVSDEYSELPDREVSLRGVTEATMNNGEIILEFGLQEASRRPMLGIQAALLKLRSQDPKALVYYYSFDTGTMTQIHVPEELLGSLKLFLLNFGDQLTQSPNGSENAELASELQSLNGEAEYVSVQMKIPKLDIVDRAQLVGYEESDVIAFSDATMSARRQLGLR